MCNHKRAFVFCFLQTAILRPVFSHPNQSWHHLKAAPSPPGYPPSIKRSRTRAVVYLSVSLFICEDLKSCTLVFVLIHQTTMQM